MNTKEPALTASLTKRVNALTAKRVSATPPALCPDLQRKTALIKAEWGDLTHFLQRFNPDLQPRLCMEPERCFEARVPALSEIRLAYGTEAPVMWLVPQLIDLSEFCGCRGKLTQRQLHQCAALITANYYHLKVSELMLYFFQFKGCRYGRFYGHVDPMIILDGLRQFSAYRARALDRIEQRRAMEEDERARAEAITYEEYLRQKHAAQNGPSVPSAPSAPSDPSGQ